MGSSAGGDATTGAGREAGARWLTDAYRAHGGELFGFAMRALGDDGLAEEAVQETFVRAWRSRHRFDPARGSVRTWLFAILRNAVADTRGSRSLSHGSEQDEAAGSDTLERQLLAWQVEEALRRIGEGHRRVLVEVTLRGRTYEEVAHELGVPLGTVKSRVYYGLRALRNVLQEMGVEA